MSEQMYFVISGGGHDVAARAHLMLAAKVAMRCKCVLLQLAALPLCPRCSVPLRTRLLCRRADASTHVQQRLAC